MKTTITLSEAQQILEKYLKTDHLLMHSKEAEIVLRFLARELGEDEELWAVTGLLHDLDMDEVKGDMSIHGIKTIEILQNEGYDIPEMFKAIKAHASHINSSDEQRDTKLDIALAAGENITGLIYAYGLMRPDKSLENAELKSVKKKFKDKSFAANVNREFIKDIEKIGMELGKFLEVSLNAMKSISKEIGL